MKFSIITITFLLSILFLTHIMQHAAYFSKLETMPNYYQSDKVFAAYFANWEIYGQNGYTIKNIYPIAHKLTHIIYAFAKPNPKTGTCDLHDAWADIGANLENRTKVSGNFAKLLKLKEKFPHLKILLSIGGATYSKNISKIAKNGDLKKFAKSCVQILDSYEYNFINSKTKKNDSFIFKYKKLFDGIDLNWEWTNNFVTESDAKYYNDLIILLRNLLNEKEKTEHYKQILTSTLQPNFKIFKALKIHTLTTYIDWFNIMTYNFSGISTQGVFFNSPINNALSLYSINTSIKNLIKIGIPTKKIVLGIPLYGQLFDQTNGKIDAPFKKTELTGPISYKTVKNSYLYNKECFYKWHDTPEVPSLYCPKYKVFISYDDEKSIQKKIQFINKNNLRGLFLWKLGDDGQDNYLVNSIFH